MYKRQAICYLCEVPINLTAPRSARQEGWEYGLHLDHVTPISKIRQYSFCLLYTSPSPRDYAASRMPSSA
ncbi:hypothetical protein [Staphylococcus aureus]